MKGNLAAVGLGLMVWLLAQGCTLITSDGADGESCDKNDACKSHVCNSGYCSGSSCKDDSSCQSGWKCTHDSADAISSFFGSSGSNNCAPLCGHCPPSMHCPKETAATPGAVCIIGKAPLEINVPATTGMVGRPVQIRATIDPVLGAITECTWELGETGPSETTTSPTITHVYKMGQHFAIRVDCKDDGGHEGGASGEVDISCQHAGDTCDPALCCGDGSGRESSGNFKCLPGTGTAPATNTCRNPKVGTITVAGPSSVALNASATYTANTDGDGSIKSVAWRFDDDYGSRPTGTTTQHEFKKAGSVFVRADVTDSLGYTTTGELTVKVE